MICTNEWGLNPKKSLIKASKGFDPIGIIRFLSIHGELVGALVWHSKTIEGVQPKSVILAIWYTVHVEESFTLFDAEPLIPERVNRSGDEICAWKNMIYEKSFVVSAICDGISACCFFVAAPLLPHHAGLIFLRAVWEGSWGVLPSSEQQKEIKKRVTDNTGSPEEVESNAEESAGGIPWWQFHATLRRVWGLQHTTFFTGK